MGASGLGSLLVREGLLTNQDHMTIRRTSGQDSNAFAKGVIALGLLDEPSLAAFLADRTMHKVVGKDLFAAAEPDALSFLDVHLLVWLEVLPLAVDARFLTVAMADPLDKAIIRQLEFFTGKRIIPVISTFSQIHDGLRKIISDFKPVRSPLEALLANHATSASNRIRLSRALASEMPAAMPKQDGFGMEQSDYLATARTATTNRGGDNDHFDDLDFEGNPGDTAETGDFSDEIDLGGLANLDGDPSDTADELLAGNHLGSEDLEDLGSDFSSVSDFESGSESLDFENDDGPVDGAVNEAVAAADIGEPNLENESRGDLLGDINDEALSDGLGLNKATQTDLDLDEAPDNYLVAGSGADNAPDGGPEPEVGSIDFESDGIGLEGPVVDDLSSDFEEEKPLSEAGADLLGDQAESDDPPEAADLDLLSTLEEGPEDLFSELTGLLPKAFESTDSDDFSDLMASEVEDDSFGGDAFGRNDDLLQALDEKDEGDAEEAEEAEDTTSAPADHNFAALNEGLLNLSLAFTPEDARIAAKGALAWTIAHACLFAMKGKALVPLVGWNSEDRGAEFLQLEALQSLPNSELIKVGQRLEEKVWSDFRPPPHALFAEWKAKERHITAVKLSSAVKTLIFVAAIDKSAFANSSYRDTVLNVLMALGHRL